MLRTLLSSRLPLLLLMLLAGVLLFSACKPAAANCNHPDHDKYIRKKTNSRMKL